MDAELDCEESVSITFEWTLRGIRSLLDSTKGDSKSKVTKSPRFGGGRWQILFYANAGAPKDGSSTEGGFVSLYLSCEPTSEEKEIALAETGSMKWVREGVYKFCFELKSLDKHFTYNAKEAQNHSFSHKTANWGWAQFARRETISYQSNTVRSEDALVIGCKITSSPTAPTAPPAPPHQLVPKSLLDTVGALLDDPLYSDVEFVFPKRGYGASSGRRIWASRRILRRFEYFDNMFSSGFSESAGSNLCMTPRSDAGYIINEFEDSDNEDEDEPCYAPSEASDSGDPIQPAHSMDSLQGALSHEPMELALPETAPIEDFGASTLPRYLSDSRDGNVRHPTPPTSGSAIRYEDDNSPQSASNTGIVRRDNDVRTPTAGQWQTITYDGDDMQIHALPSQNELALQKYESEDQNQGALGSASNPETRNSQASALVPSTPGPVYTPPKYFKVVVKDTAYSTYYAILYYIYTDSIVFAPLASSFHSKQPPPMPTPSTGPTQTQTQASRRVSQEPVNVVSRKDWIKEWQRINPGRPAPCSAKAVYRLADRLELKELKERAAQHIARALTVDNIAYEVFSPFAAAFDEIRRVQINFFLSHWQEVRASESMRNVWSQIRNGRHPGFEEVWPIIVSSLEFKPPPKVPSGLATSNAPQ